MKDSLTPRERVLRTLAFEETDRVPYDLVDGRIWPELQDYYACEYGLLTRDAILDFLGVDFRWIEVSRKDDVFGGEFQPAETWDVSVGPLSTAESEADVDRCYQTAYDPADYHIPDFQGIRARWPEYAIAFNSHAGPYFWSTCGMFGMEKAFLMMLDSPAICQALLERMSYDSSRFLTFFLERARGCVDAVELWDDMAGQQAMMVAPDWWRRYIKPYLAKDIALIRDYGMKVIFHSCGAVRPILPDLIEIGVNALEVFQTNAAGMDPGSIASGFGGRLAFYGGLEVQHLLSFATEEEVAAKVEYISNCFRDCGGFIAANCHSGIRTIKGGNITAMCRAARRTGRVK